MQKGEFPVEFSDTKIIEMSAGEINGKLEKDLNPLRMTTGAINEIKYNLNVKPQKRPGYGERLNKEQLSIH